MCFSWLWSIYRNSLPAHHRIFIRQEPEASLRESWRARFWRRNLAKTTVTVRQWNPNTNWTHKRQNTIGRDSCETHPTWPMHPTWKTKRVILTDLSSIQKNNTTLVLLLFSLAYLFKQTFAIPGSVFLNLLAGAIFGLPVGFCLTSTLTGSVYISHIVDKKSNIFFAFV